MSLLAGTLKTHIGFLLDASGSMAGQNARQVPVVMDSIIKELASKSKDDKHEVRVSIWQFNTRLTCLCYDVDVLRAPSIRGTYHAAGGTFLAKCTAEALEEAGRIPLIHGDHSHLFYVITDGEEMGHSANGGSAGSVVSGLSDIWTVAAFVPDQRGVENVQQYLGLAPGNITIWDPNERDAVVKMAKSAAAATQGFILTRSVGAASGQRVNSTKNLFSLTANVTKTAVKANATELRPDKDYELLHVTGTKTDPMPVIKPYVESWTKAPLRLGSAYYELTKPEKVQPYKQLLMLEKSTGKVFSGPEIRDILGLPSHEVKVAPADLKHHHLFVQSMRPNRKLVSGTRVIVMK